MPRRRKRHKQSGFVVGQSEGTGRGVRSSTAQSRNIKMLCGHEPTRPTKGEIKMDDEHFVTMVLRVPESVANDFQDWNEKGAPVGFVVRPEYVHRIGTLPDLPSPRRMQTEGGGFEHDEGSRCSDYGCVPA